MEDEKELIQQRDLPHDIIILILTRLPIKPLLRFKSVSKQWYSTISSSNFAHTHFKSPRLSHTESFLLQIGNKFELFSYENDESNFVDMNVDFDIGDEELVLLGSCNGLVCLGSTSGCFFIIWNPVTREYRIYSDSGISDFSPEGFTFIWGFGYVSAIDDYKVVRICKKVSDPSFTVHIFSIRFNKWRRIDNDISRFAERLRMPGVLVNETLYWMANRLISEDRLISGDLSRKVFAFDLALELFNTFPYLDLSISLPCFANYDEFDVYFDEFLCVVKGHLSKYGTYSISGEGVITILKHHGEIEHIILPTDIVGLPYKYLIGFKGGDSIFTHNYDFLSPRLGIIDPSVRPIKYVELTTLEESTLIEIISYSASFFSPTFVMGTLKPEDRRFA